MKRKWGALLIVISLAAAADGSVAVASWPGQNGRIAYASSADGINYDIYTVSSSGTDPVLIAGTADSETRPAWSSDGTKIAYDRGTPDTDAHQIYVVDAEGGEPLRITTGSERDTNPAWSPNGRLIVFQRRLPYDTLWVVGADGSNERQLTFGRGPDVDPAWSPDGKKIAFASHRDNAQMDIFVMDATGDNMINLTKADGHDRSPAWSPDGKKIAFTSDRASQSEHLSDIYVMDADGGHVKRLTTTNGLADNWQSVWSPDGSKILFQSNRNGTFHLYTIDPEGGSPQQITSGVAREEYPDWQPIPPFRHARSLSLQLKRHLVAMGDLTVGGDAPECISKARIKIQRRRRTGAWMAVKSTATIQSGTFKVRIPHRQGRYRSLAPRTVTGTGDVCQATISPIRRHRH